MNESPQTTVPSASRYENNPFYVATNGLELLFKKAQTIGIVLAIFSALTAVGSLPSTFGGGSQQSPAEDPAQSGATASIPLEAWLVIGGAIGVAIIIALLIGLIVKGVADYTAARLARGEQVALSDAFRAVFENFWGYVWVNLLVLFKTLLWTLLFIIPGIVMSVRYSLSGVSFFDKELRGDAAVQHSSKLVKGAWSTTFASQTLFNIITLGVLQTLLMPGTNAVLYGQLVSAGDEKPKAHILSRLTVVVVMALYGLLLLALIALLSWAFINYANAGL